MSGPPSNRRLRNKVHSELAALRDGGQLAVAPDPVRDYLADDRLLEQIARTYRAQRPDAPTDGHAAIITAGVPGAGKSSALNALATGYRRIDPDEIKDILLAQLEITGLLAPRLNHLLSDGNPVSPGELAGWVHTASTDAADRVRAVSLALGENFVMEGTLSWHRLVTSHVDELAVSGYERLTVLDIEVPLSVAIEQSKHRWWQARHSGAVTFGVELGGRFISEAAVAAFYSGPRTASTCAANARKLYDNANEAGIEAEVVVVSRETTGAQYGARLTPDGEVKPWQSAPLGAVCIRCGTMLIDPSGIRNGVGPTCAHKP
jgi:predicted ABC-type ATPase